MGFAIKKLFGIVKQLIDGVRELKERCSVRSKVWLEVNGDPIMGRGRLEILQAIDRRGSILGAAGDTGIPYRKIWGAIRDMEHAMGQSLVIASRGGNQGGGSSLTEVARDLVERFERLQEGMEEAVDTKFHGLFDNFFGESFGK